MVILVSKVDKLHKIKGCENLPPLPSILTKDKPIIMKILDCMQIPEDENHRFILTDENEDVVDQGKINKILGVIERMAYKCTAEEKVLQLLVIYGGHGAGYE